MGIWLRWLDTRDARSGRHETDGVQTARQRRAGILLKKANIGG